MTAEPDFPLESELDTFFGLDPCIVMMLYLAHLRDQVCRSHQGLRCVPPRHDNMEICGSGCQKGNHFLRVNHLSYFMR